MDFGPPQYSFRFVEMDTLLSIRRIWFKEEETHLCQYWQSWSWAGAERWGGPVGVCTLEDKYLGVCRVSEHLPSLSCPDRTLRSTQAFKLELSGPGSLQHLLCSPQFQPEILLFTTSNVFLWSKYHHWGRWLHFLIAWCSRTLFW